MTKYICNKFDWDYITRRLRLYDNKNQAWNIANAIIHSRRQKKCWTWYRQYHMSPQVILEVKSYREDDYLGEGVPETEDSSERGGYVAVWGADWNEPPPREAGVVVMRYHSMEVRDVKIIYERWCHQGEEGRFFVGTRYVWGFYQKYQTVEARGK